MFASLFPWLVVVLLTGVVVGLIIGIFIASALAKGHYSHFLSQTQPQEDERRTYPRR